MDEKTETQKVKVTCSRSHMNEKANIQVYLQRLNT